MHAQLVQYNNTVYLKKNKECDLFDKIAQKNQ